MYWGFRNCRWKEGGIIIFKLGGVGLRFLVNSWIIYGFENQWVRVEVPQASQTWEFECKYFQALLGAVLLKLMFSEVTFRLLVAQNSSNT